jgi:hypothetical protein
MKGRGRRRGEEEVSSVTSTLSIILSNLRKRKIRGRTKILTFSFL